MFFLHPRLLFLLLLVPLWWMGEAFYRRWQLRSRLEFAEEKFQEPLQLGAGKPRFPGWKLMWSLGLACLIAALARPQGPPVTAQEVPRPSLQIYFVLDLSLSMLARDVAPDRLAAVRAEMERVLRNLAGDRVGLIAFAGEARSLCPLTLDHDAVAETLGRLRAGMLDPPGSNPAAGLELAREKLQARPGPGKVAVIFTDGESNRPGDLAATAARAAESGVRVYAVGVGTLAGAPIPVGRNFWGKQVYRVHRGRRVISRLVSLDLRRAARAGGGVYLSDQEPGRAARGLVSRLKRLSRTLGQKAVVRRYTEYFPGLVALAFILFWLELLGPGRGRRP